MNKALLTCFEPKTRRIYSLLLVCISRAKRSIHLFESFLVSYGLERDSARLAQEEVCVLVSSLFFSTILITGRCNTKLFG